MQKLIDDEKSKSLFLNSQFYSNLIEFTNQFNSKKEEF